MNEMAAFYAAEAGMELACAKLQSSFEDSCKAPTVMPAGSETISDAVNVTFITNDDGPAVQEQLTQGTLAGLHALVKNYTVSSIGTSLSYGSQMRLELSFKAALVPLFQFAVFYDNDLEISPGPDMSILGRIHTNGDLWLNPYADLNIDSYVTSVGKIKHGPRGSYASVRSGDVLIKNTEGSYKNMKNSDGSWLDNDETKWYDSAATRWGGRVQDEAFGQERLNMPITSGDPLNIIKRYDGGANPDSYELEADAKIIDGAYMAVVGGVWQDVTSLLPAGTVTTGSFYDNREKKMVNTTNIDMSRLKTSSYFPSNGVIYSSDRRAGTYNALRLTNGSDLSNPISIFSENPMYVQGDYNTANKQPACIAADAVTFLSNSWNDANSATSSSSYSSRIPTPTACNASIMTGNTQMTSTVDNGGLENLPRFLEDWDYNKKYSILGSIVNLWHSEQATGAWKVGSPIYHPPIRDWSYDNDLDDPSKLPPKTPQIQIFIRTGWIQQDVSISQVSDSGSIDGDFPIITP